MVSGHAPPLGCWPTPVQQIPGHPGLCLKREDLSGLGFGGNEVRAVDAIVTAMRRRPADASGVLVDPVFGLPVWRTLAGRLAGGTVRHPTVLVAGGGLPAAIESARHSQVPDAAEARA